MGVKHAREYADILKELTTAVSAIEGSYSFFEMEKEEWEALGEEEKHEVMEALADDVFFGLGEQSIIEVGLGKVSYHAKHHVIEVAQGDNVTHMVRLI
ncbi:hypothetical protein SAMN04487969_12015 [Paenibacillus algorifonticola]|uniref:Uncharacterized protein n=1 Tax=Paenibacillus algorifonticola TaxID=684063 RepID=A0A1I2H6Y7_9BACL|nr:hypothetical protein [Paenibacillus algorifonticola]SFF24747.1 hypothetical protein SAMN04487969_12015 [Paenibacillus algorifonticola]